MVVYKLYFFGLILLSHTEYSAYIHPTSPALYVLREIRIATIFVIPGPHTSNEHC